MTVIDALAKLRGDAMPYLDIIMLCMLKVNTFQQIELRSVDKITFLQQ